jgi:hypothetical protein
VLAPVARLGEQHLHLVLVLLALALGGALHYPCCVAALALLDALHRLPQLLLSMQRLSAPVPVSDARGTACASVFVCGYGMTVAIGASINRQIFLLQFQVYTWHSLQCTDDVLNLYNLTCASKSVGVILFKLKMCTANIATVEM